MGKNISKEQQDFINQKIFEAISNNDWERFQLCIEKGANLNTKNGWQQTPLMYAVIYARPDAWIEFILKSEPDFFSNDAQGRTVFDLAENLSDSKERKRIMDLLLKALPSSSAEEEKPAAKEEFNPVALKRDIPAGKPIFPKPRNKNDDHLDL